MSFTRGSLRTFLSVAKTTLNNAVKGKEEVTLVVGNESADLDSITCALIYAYIRTSSTAPVRLSHVPTKQLKTSSSPASANNRFHIPILNIPRSDIQIRPELLHLLPRAGLQPSDLITLDDLPLHSSSDPHDKSPGKLESARIALILVDHNNPTPSLHPFNIANVSAIIDHHTSDSLSHLPPPSSGKLTPRIIEKAGSCTSLVLRHLQEEWDALTLSASSSTTTSAQNDAFVGVDDAAVVHDWDAQIALLGLASILTDTVCLRDESKTCEVDRRAVTYLEARLALASASNVQARGYEREKFWREVQDAKGNLDGLIVRDCLRKDYKAWTVASEEGERKVELGIASVVKPLGWLGEKASAEAGQGLDGSRSSLGKALESFAKERRLDVCVVMTAAVHEDQDSEFKRELAILPLLPLESSEKLMRTVERRAQEAKLGLARHEIIETGMSDDKDLQLRAFWQHNVGVSRKGVAPMLRAALADMLKDM